MTAPEIFDFEQGSPEWWKARLGLPTSSEFATVLAKGRDGGASKTRKTYLYKLAGEIVTGEPMESYNNFHMERGKAMEAEARAFYEFVNADAVLTRIGFVKNGRTGCSPDALIGDDGVLEIKTAAPHIMVETILADKFPPEHWAQCQGALWVTGRKFVDLIVYWPSFPPFIKRANRDEDYIEALAGAVDQFNAEIDALVARIRAYGSGQRSI